MLYGDPLGGPGSGSKPGADSNRWTGDDATYMAVHLRVRDERGAASQYPCTTCGQTAREWAYDHADPNERVSDDGRVFSLDLTHYIPLCASDHRLLDHSYRKEQGNAC